MGARLPVSSNLGTIFCNLEPCHPCLEIGQLWSQRLTVRANGCNAFDCNCRARDRWLPREPRDAEQLTERLPKIWLP